MQETKLDRWVRPFGHIGNIGIGLFFLTGLDADQWSRDPAWFLQRLAIGVLLMSVGSGGLLMIRSRRLGVAVALAGLLVALLITLQIYFPLGSVAPLLIVGGPALLLGIGYLRERRRRARPDKAG